MNNNTKEEKVEQNGLEKAKKGIVNAFDENGNGLIDIEDLIINFKS